MTVLMSIMDAARVTRVPAGTIRRWLSSGRLLRYGDRKPWWVDVVEIDTLKTGGGLDVLDKVSNDLARFGSLSPQPRTATVRGSRRSGGWLRMPLLAPPPNRFAVAADLILDLPAFTAAARTRMKITPAVQAKQIGISKSTLTRLEAGSSPNQATIVSVLRWLSIHGGQ